MEIRSFAVNFDYRCPFARNANELVVAGLASGAPWDVTFVPFCLGQTKVQPGGPSVWDDPGADSGLVALEAGTAVRDHQPERFPDAHLALFALRHDYGGDLRDQAAVAETLAAVDVDVPAVLEAVTDGAARKTVRVEHEEAADHHNVWGVPTFIVDGQAAFIRLMDRHDGNPSRAVDTIERVLDVVKGWPVLNELKHTTISR